VITVFPAFPNATTGTANLSLSLSLVFDGDGAAALLRHKKTVGAITIAQKLDTAAQPDMPESAIESGCIDFVLSPEDIAKRDCTNCGKGVSAMTCSRCLIDSTRCFCPAAMRGDFFSTSPVHLPGLGYNRPHLLRVHSCYSL